MSLILTLKSLQSKIGKFSVIGGCAYFLQTGINKKPKDIDIIPTREITSFDLERIGIYNYNIYPSSFDQESSLVSDFVFRGLQIQLVYADPDDWKFYSDFNDWEFHRNFKFISISGIQVADLESIVDNTKKGKVKKYSNLPILENWEGTQFSDFLRNLSNKENAKELLVSFFITHLDDDTWDLYYQEIKSFKLETLHKNGVFIKLFKIAIQ